MIPAAGHRGQPVGVLGLGRTGLAAARSLVAGGARPIVWDDGREARERAAAEGFELRDLTAPGAQDDLAALVVSPGIPHLYPAPHPAVAEALAAGVPFDNDVGLFFRALGELTLAQDRPARVIAVTGSNGKSTTAALIAHVLAETGRGVQLAGNIGRSVLAIEPPADGSFVVIELSSYQIELARALTPDVAVFTNLSPDHLDRHGGLGGYFAAKRRLFAEGGPDRAVIGIDEAEGRFLANQIAAFRGDDRVIRVATGMRLRDQGWAVWARKGWLAEWRRGRQMASVDLRAVVALSGAHNHQNACAAWAALRACGLGPREIAPALESFRGLPHRTELVAEAAGVRFVNDSKATNVESARHALRAFPRIRWIAGGLGKEGGIGALAPDLGNVVKAYLIGHSAREFARQLGTVPHEICESMEVAVARAAAEARPGETVLLAPAAASFDQYPDFEARGRDFEACVRRALSARGEPGPER